MCYPCGNRFLKEVQHGYNLYRPNGRLVTSFRRISDLEVLLAAFKKDVGLCPMVASVTTPAASVEGSGYIVKVPEWLMDRVRKISTSKHKPVAHMMEIILTMGLEELEWRAENKGKPGKRGTKK